MNGGGNASHDGSQSKSAQWKVRCDLTSGRRQFAPPIILVLQLKCEAEGIGEVSTARTGLE